MDQAAAAMDRSRALYERPAPTSEDPVTFAELKRAVESRFAEDGVRDFLRTLDKANLRIRSFEEILAAGKLGAESARQYATLSPGDQGQVRELYLALLEQVPMPLRDKFFKLYAYY